jgi:recombination protein RecA
LDADPQWDFERVRGLERDKSLEMALMQIERQFGRGSIMKLGAEADRMAVEAVPTGSIALDIALGVGGVPRGRVIEIFGPESSGKTTVALQIIAEAQRMGGVAAFIDAENALDPTYSKALGVDIDELLISQPDTGEQALEITELLVRSAAVDVVVIDSVAALVPRAEIEGDIGDSHVGLQARLMSQALRKLSNAINRSNTIAIFINQLREKIGVMFGNPEVTPGGRALKFYSSIRIDLRKIDTIKKGTDIVGNRVRARVVKNKVAPPFRNAEFDIMYGEGISKEGDLLDLGVVYEVVKKSGAWYMYKEDQLGQGRENAKAFLLEHADISSKIENVIRESAGLKQLEDIDVSAEATAKTEVTPVEKKTKSGGKGASSS